MKRLAIVTTHPIQYNAPLYALLAGRGKVQIKVFYTWGESVLKKKYDPGFGKNIEWDIPLLNGYDYSFVKNIAVNPGSHHFRGIDNPFLINEIEQWKANAVLVYGWNFKSHLQLLRYFHNKIPVFFRGDSTLLNEPALLKKILRSIFLKWVYSKVNFALFVGSHNKNYYEAFGLKQAQLIFAPHAIDNDRFMNPDKILNEQASLKRKELGIDPDAVIFLFAGKLDSNKNVQLLLRAFIDFNNTETHLLIAGNGVAEPALRTMASGKKNIHFLPFQNQAYMPILYRIGNITVLPSITETWGLSINEAMACGRPVLISSTCGAAIDLVRDGENGYVFNSNDPSSLLEKMQKMLDQKDDLDNWGRNGQQIITEWSHTATCEIMELTIKKNA